MYAGDFPTAKAEAARVLEENPKYEYARLTLALSTLALGSADDARREYERLSEVSPLGQSLASMGLADLELFFGRPKAAIGILKAGIAADEKAKSVFNAALKHVGLAEAYLASGDRRRAAASASRAAVLSDHESVRFPAARVLVASGQSEKAQKLAEVMENVIQSQTRSYGRLLTGALAIERKRYPDAIDAIRAGLKLHDSWLGHVLLGDAYAAAGQSAQALAEWELCLKRRGEATDAFFADSSTLRYLPPIHYWHGRAQEALGSLEGARRSYGEFLKLRAGDGVVDTLVADAKRRSAR
jgi:tetratricopeptide (TPR) repeat protein